jgi:choloylglycine hydrolase
MKKCVALLLLVLHCTALFACSTFLLSKNGTHVFGRNYDWVSGNGMVVVNARGVSKTSFAQPGAKTISWISKNGSITFNQFGKEFPHGGMNEKGLVVELMWLSETGYPSADNRAGTNELQWIQYQLDNCVTINEVIATDRLIRIDRQGAAPLHYLIADASGKAATIEFINGKMAVHQGASLPHPVLTNTVYSDAMQQFKGMKAEQTSGNSSVDRFATACRMVQQFHTTYTNENAVDYAFSILDNIAQGNYTKWRIVYDITARQVYFVTSGIQNRRKFSLSNFNFDCSRTALAFPLESPRSGAIAPYFSPLDNKRNKVVMERSAEESRSAIQIPDAQIAGAAAYFSQVRCRGE